MIVMGNREWTALASHISSIDGGCIYCIKDFLTRLATTHILTKEMLRQINVYDKPLPEELVIKLENSENYGG